jgi:hypothetical protein
MSDLIVLEAGGRWIALTLDELQQFEARVSQVLPPRAVTTPAAPTLLDADGMAAATGVPASWFAAAARENKISYVPFGRWVRFDLAVVAKELAHARKTAESEPIAKLGRSRRQKLNGIGARA